MQISKPQNGAWSRTTSPDNAPAPPEKTSLPQVWQTRHVSDEALARASEHAEKVNTKTPLKVVRDGYSEASDTALNKQIEILRRLGKEQAERFITERQRGAKTL